MMTDDEFQVFVTLKFNGLQDIIDSFRNAIGIPSWADTDGSNTDAAIKCLEFWAEAGAPDKYEIPIDEAEAFLILRFGSVDAAWDYVMSRPFGEGHGLQENEIKVVMNYVKPGTT